MSSSPEGFELFAGISRDELNALLAGEHSQPHRILGAHPVVQNSGRSIVVRAFHPDAIKAECLMEGGPALDMKSIAGTRVFAVRVDRQLPTRYRIRFRFAYGHQWEQDDPYRFLPTIGDMDLHLFNEGTHRRLWHCLGSHPRCMDGVEGVAFAVWAPNARRVSVVGDFCGWDGRLYPMRQMGSSGVFELFIPALKSGGSYKYEIKCADGHLRLKADPFAFAAQIPPGTASIVHHSSHRWNEIGRAHV